MYSSEDLCAAVEAGVLSQEQVNAFRAFIEQRSITTLIDEEHFRLVTGFNDIFVVVASALLLMACYLIGEAFVAAWFGHLTFALATWLLSEYFVRIRRMALPAIVFLLAFVSNLFCMGVFALGLQYDVLSG